MCQICHDAIVLMSCVYHCENTFLRLLLLIHIAAFTTPAQSQHAVTCFRCDAESSPRNCIHVTTCDMGMVCLTFAILGRKRNNYCHMCCSDDFCNDRCDALITPAPTTPSQPPSTTSKTTTSTTTTSTTTTSATTTPKPTTTPTKTTTITTPKPATRSTTTTSTPKPTTTTTTTTPKPTTTTTSTTTPTATTTSQQLLHELCDQRHYHYNEHSSLCYKLHAEDKTWGEANKVCQHEGGTLAIINSQTKWDVLTNVMKQDHTFAHLHSIFIGGRYIEHDNVYQWVNAETILFADWAVGEPRDHQADGCIYMKPSEDFQWYYTSYCGQLHRFVCTIQL